MAEIFNTALPPPVQHRTGADGLTVLRTIGGKFTASKQWTWNKHQERWLLTPYKAGEWFTATEHSVANLAELVTVLDVVRRDPCAFVVRGALAPGAAAAVAANPRHRIKRLKKQQGKYKATLLEVARRWLMVDIDGWKLRPSDDLATDPASAIEAAVSELLPAAFHDASYWWQLSSSAWFEPGVLKVHLFFWLTEPADNLHIKAVLKQHAPRVDPAPFNAAQPHYIAEPVIQGGYDPLPVRTGWRQGLDEAVELPAVVSKPGEAVYGDAAGVPGGVLDAMAFVGDGEGGQGFHKPLFTASVRYAKECRESGTRNDAAIKDALRSAMRAAPQRAGRSDVESKYCQDSYLDPLINSAFAFLETKDGPAKPAKAPKNSGPVPLGCYAAQLPDGGTWTALPAYYPGVAEPQEQAAIIHQPEAMPC